MQKQTFIFIGYDIPEALDAKWDIVMPLLDRQYKAMDYEGDRVHLVNGKADIWTIQNMLDDINEKKNINLTLDVWGEENES